LAKFHQNCSNGSGVLRLFSSKNSQLPIFCCKNAAKKSFSLRTAKNHQYSPRAGHTHSKNTGHSNFIFKTKFSYHKHIYLFLQKSLPKKSLVTENFSA
jgi:hypothetical protein